MDSLKLQREKKKYGIGSANSNLTEDIICLSECPGCGEFEEIDFEDKIKLYEAMQSGGLIIINKGDFDKLNLNLKGE